MTRTIRIHKYALATRVLVVAVVNIEDGKLFDWAAYVDAVPGINHENEAERVAGDGAKVSEELAKIMFPELDIERYRL